MQLSSFCLKKLFFSASRLPHCGVQSDPAPGKSCAVRGAYIVRAMDSDGGVSCPPGSTLKQSGWNLPGNEAIFYML